MAVRVPARPGRRGGGRRRATQLLVVAAMTTASWVNPSHHVAASASNTGASEYADLMPVWEAVAGRMREAARRVSVSAADEGSATAAAAATTATSTATATVSAVTGSATGSSDAARVEVGRAGAAAADLGMADALATPRVHVFTYATGVRDEADKAGLCGLLESAAHSRVELEVLGWGEEWVNTGQKVEGLARRLRDVHTDGDDVHSGGTVADSDIVLFVDAFDTVFVDGTAALLGAFRRSGADVLFNTDCNAHPFHLYSNFTTHLYSLRAAREQGSGGHVDHPYPYLNSGVFVGHAWAVRRMLRVYEAIVDIAHSFQVAEYERQTAASVEAGGRTRLSPPPPPVRGVSSSYDQEVITLAFLADALGSRVALDHQGELAQTFAPAAYPHMAMTGPASAHVTSRPHTDQTQLARCNPVADLVRPTRTDTSDGATPSLLPIMLGSRFYNRRTDAVPCILHFNGVEGADDAWDSVLARHMWYSRQGGSVADDRHFPPLSRDELNATTVVLGDQGGARRTVTYADMCQGQ